jgi:hypothetical protein
MVDRNTRHIFTAIPAIGLAAGVFLSAVSSPRIASADDKAAAFIGGLIGGHVLTNFARERREQTQALQEMAHNRQPAYAPVYREPAYSAPPPAYSAPPPAPAPAQNSAQSIESKLNTLDQLAAKGYITKEEYQRRREAILNSL